MAETGGLYLPPQPSNDITVNNNSAQALPAFL